MNVTHAGLPPCRFSTPSFPQEQSSCGSEALVSNQIAQEALQAVGDLNRNAHLGAQRPKMVLDHLSVRLLTVPTTEDIKRHCQQMLTVIEKTLVQCPTLTKILPAVKNLVARERKALACDGREFARVQRICRECLGQLAKIWGYNQPQWLLECLPLLGYIQRDLQGSYLLFEKSERYINAIPTICQHAILAGNLEALNVVLNFVPTAAVEYLDHSDDLESSWGFLYFAHKNVTPATRLVCQDKWSTLEFSGFASCYGTSAAEALREISPAYNQRKAQLCTQTRKEIFALWAFRDQGAFPEVILDRLIQIAKEHLSIYKMPLEQRFREQICPVESVPENLLRCFPFHLMNWGLALRSNAPSLSAGQWHHKLLSELSELRDPKHSSEISSIFQALAQFLYSFGNLAGDLKFFCKVYLDETVGALKSRLDFQELIDQVPTDKSTLQLSGFQGARLKCLLSGVVICALVSHVYHIQVHFCCLLQLPKLQIEDLLMDLKWHLTLLGLDKEGLRVDQCVDARGDKTGLSVLINPSCNKRCEIFAIDRLVQVDDPEGNETNKNFSKKVKTGGRSNRQVQDFRKEIPVIAYFWRGDPPLS